MALELGTQNDGKPLGSPPGSCGRDFGCRMEEYELLGKIGEGTFGVVFRGRHVRTGDSVALKKIRLRNASDGLPKKLLREIQALQSIDHANVITLREYFPYGSSIILSFDYMNTDLHQIMRYTLNRGEKLCTSAVKSILIMLLDGVASIHEASMMHRDLKPANILFTKHGELKIGDFGLARVYERDKQDASYSHEVATRWYRAPELLYGAHKYTQSVDMWAVGCIMAELLTGWPLFTGENDIDQLFKVQKGLGSPNTKIWPGLEDLPDFNKIQFPHMEPLPFSELIPDVGDDALHVLQRLLVYNPADRLTAREALCDPFFYSDPIPLHCSELSGIIHRARMNKEAEIEENDVKKGGKSVEHEIDAPLVLY